MAPTARRKSDVEHRVSWITIQDVIWELADKLKASKFKPDFVCGIPRGGLVPAVMLSHAMGIPFVVDHEEARPDRATLIIDDVADSGSTLSEVTLGPMDRRASLFRKPRSRVTPDFWVREIKNNIWIVFPWELDPDV